jgi:2-dehydropantoate 2-reductase
MALGRLIYGRRRWAQHLRDQSAVALDHRSVRSKVRSAAYRNSPGRFCLSPHAFRGLSIALTAGGGQVLRVAPLNASSRMRLGYGLIRLCAASYRPCPSHPMPHPSFDRVCIYGAGAIGTWIACHLAQAGAQVSVVARGATLQAIQADGLSCTNAEQTLHCQVTASADPAALGPQDLVVLALKAPALPDIASRIAPLLAPHTLVLTAMNGVPWWFLAGFGGAYADRPLPSIDPKGTIAAAIPTAHVVGGVVHASCSLQGPGRVQHHFGRRLIIGEPSGQKTERLQALAALLTRAGFETEVSAQIQRDIWYKLWGNLTVNPISALTGATTDRILADPLVREFTSKVMLEAKAIGERLGIPILQQPEDRHAVTAKLGAFKTSMLQDVQAGRAVEIDALVTVMRELGQLTNIATPNTDILLGLARLQARTLGLY